MRRYQPLRQSIGTVIPLAVRHAVMARDKGCVGPRIGMESACSGGLELDHIQASHGMGMKTPSTENNLATLCNWHHRVRTEAGRFWRPKLLAYLSATGPG